MTFADEIARARNGDVAALNRLLDQVRPILRIRAHGLVSRQLGRRVDTSDIVQEAMTQVYRDAADFRGQSEGEWWAWIQRILTGTAGRLRRFHRAAKRNVAAETLSAVLSTVETDHNEPSDRVERNEQLLRLGAAIESLPDEMREVIVARVIHREPFDAIAERLGRPPSTTRVIWTRAVRELQQRIQSETENYVSR